MNQDYELKFYENADRCFEYLDEKYPGMWFVPHAKAAINYLWSNEDLVIEDVPIEHEIVQARMMERLNVDKLEEYLKEKEERGWFLEKTQQITVGEVDFEKTSNRENMRLRMSLDAAKSLQQSGHGEKEILCFLHFPLVWGDFVATEMLQTLQAYGVRRCYYGHIHGTYHAPRTQSYENLTLSLISSDFLDFVPHKILPL